MEPLTIRYVSQQPLEQPRPGDAGIDLYWVGDSKLGNTYTVYTGVRVEIPDGHVGLVSLRSGFASKHYAHMFNAPGIIDSSYRGEILVKLLASSTPEIGERFAQLVVLPLPTIRLEQTTELSETWRGDGGFGSTGVH